MGEKEVIVYKGKTYPSHKSLCNELGISYGGFLARKNSESEPLEQTITYMLNKKNKITYQGKGYPSIIALCTELGISYSTFSARKNRVSETLEQTVDYCLSKQAKKITYQGKDYPSEIAIIKAFGLTRSAIRWRMERNHVDFITAFEDALKYSERTSGNKAKREAKKKRRVKPTVMTVCNEQFKTKRDICKKYNISYNTFIQKNIKLGYSPEEAVLYTKVPGAKSLMAKIKHEGYEYSLVSIGDKEFSVMVSLQMDLSCHLSYSANGGVVHLKTRLPISQIDFERLNEMNAKLLFGKYIAVKMGDGTYSLEHRFSTMLHGEKDVLFFVFMAMREVEKNEMIRRATEKDGR